MVGLTQKQAQQHIIEWCQMWQVPIIPVILKNTPRHLRMEEASFDGNTFNITIYKDTDLETLKHEFGHYLHQIIKSAEFVEEQMCEFFEPTKTE